MPETPKVAVESSLIQRLERKPISNLESYTMLCETIGHQVTMIGFLDSESFTTSCPSRNLTG